MSDTPDTSRTALVVGASRTIGLALATELADRGWKVIGTARTPSGTGLHDAAAASDGRITTETLDITDPAAVSALRRRLDGTVIDLLFVNAGISNGMVPVGEVTTDDFVDVMVTNALSPMRVIETLGDLVPATGAIGVMSSRQGSVSLNTRGGFEVYRASKSALNQLMRSYAARHADDPRTLLLIAPGWIKTDLGGDDAPLTIGDSIPRVAAVIERTIGTPGLHFLSYEGDVVPW